MVQGRAIRTTGEHPFWVDGKGWTAAGELKAGDQLLGADKSKLPVESVVETEDTETVYNFRVADWHTYFVGNEHWDFEVWVHNACASGANGQTPNSNFGVNPFRGKTPQQIDELLTSREFIKVGPDPMNGKGAYFHPTSGRKYYLDPGGVYKSGTELPHVDVHRMLDGKNIELLKRKYPIGESLYG